MEEDTSDQHRASQSSPFTHLANAQSDDFSGYRKWHGGAAPAENSRNNSRSNSRRNSLDGSVNNVSFSGDFTVGSDSGVNVSGISGIARGGGGGGISINTQAANNTHHSNINAGKHTPPLSPHLHNNNTHTNNNNNNGATPATTPVANAGAKRGSAMSELFGIVDAYANDPDFSKHTANNNKNDTASRELSGNAANKGEEEEKLSSYLSWLENTSG